MTDGVDRHNNASRKNGVRYKCAALALTVCSFFLSVGFWITLGCGLLAMIAMVGSTICDRPKTSRWTLRTVAVLGFICALGNIVVASTAEGLAYCQEVPSNCDEVAWKILGPLAGLLWLLDCYVILQIPIVSVVVPSSADSYSSTSPLDVVVANEGFMTEKIETFPIASVENPEPYRFSC